MTKEREIGYSSDKDTYSASYFLPSCDLTRFSNGKLWLFGGLAVGRTSTIGFRSITLLEIKMILGRIIEQVNAECHTQE